MINSFVSALLIAVLSIFNPLLTLLGVGTFFTSVTSFISQITTSSGWAYFLDLVGSLFYFVPKSTIVLLLGFSVVILLVRIGLAIVSEVWIG